MKNGLKRTEYELLASFRYGLRLFLRFSEAAAREAGIEHKQHQAMLAIKGFAGPGRISVRELAERLQIQHHSAVGLVNRLVSNGLVYREAAAGDRRLVHLALTQKGEQLLDRLVAAHRQELRRLRPHLKALLELLDKATSGRKKWGSQ
jgi:DNA-binding MarR family transcriptional regulator